MFSRRDSLHAALFDELEHGALIGRRERFNLLEPLVEPRPPGQGRLTQGLEAQELRPTFTAGPNSARSCGRVRTGSARASTSSRAPAEM